MKTTNVDELARLAEGEGEASFVARNPAPFLVFLESSERGSLTDSSEETQLRTSFGPLTASGLTSTTKGGGGGHHSKFKLSGKSLVLPLVKSARNPFGNMITVGRAPNNDVWIPHGSVSKFHAYFTWSDEGWRITDEKSMNGTSVDRRALPPAGSAALACGSEVDFGNNVRVRFLTAKGIYALLGRYRTGTLT